MAGQAEATVAELAQQLCDGFAALSGEYQVLFDQQRQLESKLSWAKQQVRYHPLYFPSLHDEYL
jgi:hypothetical protein